MPSKPCPKCNSSMTEGFVVDQAYGSMAVPGWIEGKPQRSVWTGVKILGKPRYEIATWRCSRCGFLEHYASTIRSDDEEKRKQVTLALIILGISVAVLAAVGVALLALSR